MQIYTSLTSWYYLLDPTEDHQEEAACYQEALDSALPAGPATLLDLGAGAGNNAYHLKARFDCTLTDLSEPMLALSRALNPDCEHLQGDMRSLRLGRTFDAVLVHDAVMYLTTEDDLRACIQTAFVHTRPGGAALFAPDSTRETFVEQTNLYEQDDPATGRSLRTVEWSWDPGHSPNVVAAEYIFAMRDADGVRVVHDHHDEGVFPHATWLRLLTEAGYTVSMAERRDEGDVDHVFLCKRP